MAKHVCKQASRINRMDREQGEFKATLQALVGRFDRLTQVQIAVGVVLLGNLLVTLGFLVSFWIETLTKGHG